MGKVIGIGGVFFKSKNPKKLNAWYRDHLGLDVSEWGGTTFSWDSKDGAKRDRQTLWTPFAADTKHFAPSKESFMVNFMVDDLAGLMKKLKAAKVKIDKKGIEASEYGNFAWIIDPDGRKVELWEPPLKAKKK